MLDFVRENRFPGKRMIRKTFSAILSAAFLFALVGCGAGGGVSEPTIIFGREVAHSNGKIVVADTASSFHINDILNIELRVPDAFLRDKLMLKVYWVEDENGKRFGTTENLTRSQTLNGINPKAQQMVLNNSDKSRTLGKFIGAKAGVYRVEFHTESYKIAERELRVYKKGK